jgi:guanylate kinase
MLLDAEAFSLLPLDKPRGRGVLYIVSGPSGVGKGTIVKALVAVDPAVKVSVSVTTRAPRPGEIEGQSYFFRSPEEFERMIEADELLEHAQFGAHWYGTPRHFVEEQLAAGFDVVLEIEVQGGIQVRDKMPGGVYVFVLPPSFEALAERLRDRRSETPDAVQERLRIARGELDHLAAYDYQVVNDDLNVAVKKFQSIFTAQRCRVHRRN